MRMRGQRRQRGWRAGWLGVPGLLFALTLTAAPDRAAVQKLFLKGEYSDCIRLAKDGVKNSPWSTDWRMLLARAQLAVGRYPEALTTITNALDRNDSSLALRLLAYDVFNANGRTNRAQRMLDELGRLARGRIRSIRDPADLVALGRAALLLQVDPKLVLDNFFDQAKQMDPTCREAYLAAGDLALDKQDYALASKLFSGMLQKFPGDPDAQFGLARAYAPSDAAQTAKSLTAVLDGNPNHVPALLLLADHLIDAEEYTNAAQTLGRVLDVNPWCPEAWAYRAVLASLRNDTNAETAARRAALKFWPTSPRVDFLIGKKLAQKYRFAEGAAFERQTLKVNPGYLPAELQLAQDLLRLGDETEGWRLVEQAHDQDGYDVTAYNLVTLHDTMATFQTLTNRHFIVRMSPSEAALYGDRVLALLDRAWKQLTAKYGFEPDRLTVVEIFPEQKDFAVRTFGFPQDPGFLGVCFGHVITANSPAAFPGHPDNWQTMLWHEFGHVITLGLTRNKMPRWLSEGISVYEERQADPSWGQAMTPRYCDMILGSDLTPIGKLSAAFLSPKDPLHIQFAYFESSLVVEYLVKTFGFASLKAILVDLGNGVEINDAIAHHTEPLAKLEGDFAAFARAQTRNLAPGLDWNRPEGMARAEPAPASTNLLDRLLHYARRKLSGPATEPLATRLQSTNYWVLSGAVAELMEAKKWHEAKAPLGRLIRLYPNPTGGDSAYAMMAVVCRQLNETNAEHAALVKLAALDDTAIDAYLRLMEMDAAAQDWTGVIANARRFLAVNPLVPQPYRYLAQAGEALNRTATAVGAYRRLLRLDPADPVEVHFHLARLLRRQGHLQDAKRQVLEALEDAPRFRDAQRLLLELEPVAPPAAPAKQKKIVF
jgi:tetratricopeptide (TPR) repeat protein